MKFLKKSTLLLLLLTSIGVQAQLKYHIEPSVNFGLITNSSATSTKEVSPDRPNLKKYQTDANKAEYGNKPGAGLRIGVNYFFKENFSLNTGVDFSNIYFKQTLNSKTSFFYQQAGSSNIIETEEGKQSSFSTASHSLFLLSIPIGASYYLLDNDLSVDIGLLPGILLGSTGGSGKSSAFNKPAMGMQLQLKYQFIPQWRIVAGFQEYSTKLYDPALRVSYSNIRYLKIGLSYEL